MAGVVAGMPPRVRASLLPKARPRSGGAPHLPPRVTPPRLLPHPRAGRRPSTDLGEAAGEAGWVGATNPHGFTESYTYEATGEVSSVKDRLARTTTMAHDQLGRLLTMVDTLGRRRDRSYTVPTGGAWSGPSLTAASANGTASTTSLSGTLRSGDYQLGINAFDTEGFPAQITLYRDARPSRSGTPAPSTTASGSPTAPTARVAKSANSEARRRGSWGGRWGRGRARRCRRAARSLRACNNSSGSSCTRGGSG